MFERWRVGQNACVYSCLTTISHDRRFLNAICDEIADIDFEAIIIYPGNYDEMVRSKANVRSRVEKDAAQREKKIAEAKDALRAHERAKWQSKIADTMESFEVAGIDATHQEMLDRINEETAKNEARMELALDSVDTDTFKIEEEAEGLRAAELVAQFKTEMGLDSFEDPLKDLDLDSTTDKATE